jgi:hypothetical protein
MTVHYSLRLSIYLNLGVSFKEAPNEREIGDRLSLFVAADHLALGRALEPTRCPFKLLHRSLTHCNSFTFSSNIQIWPKLWMNLFQRFEGSGRRVRAQMSRTSQYLIERRHYATWISRKSWDAGQRQDVNGFQLFRWLYQCFSTDYIVANFRSNSAFLVTSPWTCSTRSRLLLFLESQHRQVNNFTLN